MSESQYEYLLCDLDDTLYSPHCGVMRAVGERIHLYMVERLAFSAEDTRRLRQEYVERYGTSLRGLVVNYHIDPEAYMDFVHDLPLEQLIQADPPLDTMLASIPLRKVVFTNASREHASRVLNVLGVRHRFDHIVDVRDFDFQSKPHPSAYQRILEILHVAPHRCIMVEDSIRNLAPARALGMTTVWVSDGVKATATGESGVDYCIPVIHHLGDVLDQLIGRAAR
jgi:putative hydrolase of the HAD superfamily